MPADPPFTVLFKLRRFCTMELVPGNQREKRGARREVHVRN